MKLETPLQIQDALPYTLESGWIIHEINGTNCIAQCPRCKKRNVRQLNNLIYKRPRTCISCRNKLHPRRGRSVGQITVKVDSELLALFRHKLELENKLVTHVITQMIEEYCKDGSH